MTDGTRTHDHRDHNPGLYQLSYSHHRVFIWRAWQDYSVLPVPHPSGRPTAVQLLFQTKLSNLFTVQVNQNIKINMAHILPYLFYGAPGRTRTCYPRLSLPSTPFDALILSGLWSGLSLHHHRCRTYSLYGSLFPGFLGIAISPELIIWLLRVPRYSAIHFMGSVSP